MGEIMAAGGGKITKELKLVLKYNNIHFVSFNKTFFVYIYIICFI